MPDHVVDLATARTRKTDPVTAARRQFARCRAATGQSPAEFAASLGKVLGVSVHGKHVTAWETSAVPPGDVLVAASMLSPSAMPPVEGFLSAPPSFPATALAGPWVTCYQFTHSGRARCHADVAHVEARPDGIRAVNHPPEPRSEGRPRSFRNEITARLVGRHLIGEWVNTSDTRYYGALQLAVLPGETVMEGYFTGVGSDIEVSTGFWKWVRLDPSFPGPDLAGFTLRDPAELFEIVMSHSQYGAPLAPDEIGEEPQCRV